MYRQEEYEALERAYFSDQMHERDALGVLRGLLNGARCFVDVGASLGQFTRCAAETMSGGRIVAVEADPERFERLQANCKAWAASSPCEIVGVHAAAVDHDGAVTFFTTDSRVSGGLFVHETATSGAGGLPVSWRKITVQGCRLDALAADRIPDVVKIDVEGAELRVLKGADRLLRRGHTIFLVELHPWTDPGGQRGPGDVEALMAARGYLGIRLAGKTVFVHKRRIAKWLPLTVRSAVTRLLRRLRILSSS